MAPANAQREVDTIRESSMIQSIEPFSIEVGSAVRESPSLESPSPYRQAFRHRQAVAQDSAP